MKLSPAASPDRAPEWKVWVMAAAVVLAVVAAYAPVFQAGFVWDDDGHVTRPALRSLEGLWRIWFEPGSTQQSYPLLHSAFWLEHRLWGGAALGYHLVNLGLHALAALLFGRILSRLSVPAPWLAAAVFALHPVHVESVAWISEQKNTLSAVFYLSAALAYLRFDSLRTARHFALASLLFVGALLSKSVTATLPAALLVVLWWKRGGLSMWRDIVPLLPWFFLGIAAGLHTAWVERHFIGADGAPYDLSLLQRLVLAPRAILFYVGQLLWPADLIFIHPRWDINPGSPSAWLPIAVIAASTIILFRIRVVSRAPMAAWLIYVGTLLPVLGFFNIYPFVYSFVADHFQYLASLPLIAAISAGLAGLLKRQAHLLRLTGTTALLLLLGTLTWQQSRIYHDDETLFRATITRNPRCWMAFNNLGRDLLADPMRRSEAIACFQSAIDLRPDYFGAHNNLGLALTQDGRPTEAVGPLQTAAALRPNSHEVHNNLGIALATSGRAEDAVVSFAEAARLNPRLPNIHENWAKALLLLGRHDEASERKAEAVRLRDMPPR